MLTTDRLALVPLDAERHFEDFAAMAADDAVTRWLGAPGGMDRANAWRTFAMILGHWSIRGYGFFAVEERETGAFVGRVGPWFPEEWPDKEIGWAIARAHWGKGYAGEAAEACMDYAFSALGWERATHMILPENANSIRVAEKLGAHILERGVELKGLPVTYILDSWGQTAAQWRARKS